jgi:hypothetical protein
MGRCDGLCAASTLAVPALISWALWIVHRVVDIEIRHERYAVNAGSPGCGPLGSFITVDEVVIARERLMTQRGIKYVGLLVSY